MRTNRLTVRCPATTFTVPVDLFTSPEPVILKVDGVLGLCFAAAPGKPAQLGGSSWQSFFRGTGTIETKFLNGEIVLIADQLGQAAPVNARLTAVARRAARERQRPGAFSAEELRAVLCGPHRVHATTDTSAHPSHHSNHRMLARQQRHGTDLP